MLWNVVRRTLISYLPMLLRMQISMFITIVGNGMISKHELRNLKTTLQIKTFYNVRKFQYVRYTEKNYLNAEITTQKTRSFIIKIKCKFIKQKLKTTNKLVAVCR